MLRLRANGGMLLVGDRRVVAPLRLTPPLRIQVVGSAEVIPLRHPTEITARNGALVIVS